MPQPFVNRRLWTVFTATSVLTACGGGQNDKTTTTTSAPAPAPAASVTLQSIGVEPASVITVVGGSQQFVVRGRYSDGSTALINSGVTWASSAATVADVGASTGLATAASAGTATLTATYGSLIATGTHTVSTPYAALAAGGAHANGIKTDGTLWGWGLNRTGQVGDNTQTDRLVPTAVGTAKIWAMLADGEFHSLGLQTDGTLWAWGFNQNGQLGQGNFGDLKKPTAIGTKKDWVTLSAGQYHSGAINKVGELYMWGRNASGQLGDGTVADRPDPTLIALPTAYQTAVEAAATAAGLTFTLAWTHVAAGADHTLARMNDGSLWAWGSNFNGQLGRVTLTPGTASTATGSAPALSPGRVVLLRANGSEEAASWSRLAGGGSHSLAVRSTGELYAWGSNLYGQLGLATNANMAAPTRVGTDGDWSQIAAGADYSIAIRLNGTFWSWGSNGDGQLGNGGQNNVAQPTQVGTGSNWVKLAAGRSSSYGLRTDGLLLGWGRNVEGQLGNGTVNSRALVPTPIP